MKHVIIGTAGHVDHGKSALIRALTGVQTDRFPEEQQRGISIDIGFAEFRLPSGRRAGVIDVPGHERFIKNMLAGVTGIDLVLLVVAADEGVMPQTREHLDILRLLEVKSGIVVLTKRDLVDDEMLELVAEDVRDAAMGTFLAEAPIMSVSSTTGEGVTELVQRVDDMLVQTEVKDVTAFARLPIDRAFIRPGFGTVVTGTLVGGIIREGDRLELLPQALEVRVRGLHVHGEAVAQAEAGQRVAVNLAGIERSHVKRGHVLCVPGVLRPTTSFAGRVQLLSHWPKPLQHGVRVHVHTGTTDLLGRVLLLDQEELDPGESAYVQIKTEEPVVVGRGDRFIIRSYSPVHTMGGGAVVEPHAHYKRSQAENAVAELRVKETGGTAGVIAETLLAGGTQPVSLAELSRRTGIPTDVLDRELAEVADEVRRLDGGLLIHRRGFRAFLDLVQEHLGEFYRQFPLRLGVGKEELRRRLGTGAKEFAALLGAAVSDGVVTVDRDRVAQAGRSPSLNAGQDKIADRLRDEITQAGCQPLSVAELRGRVSARDTDEILIYLTEQGESVRLSDDLIIGASVLSEATERTRRHLREHGKITVAEFRDLLATTRKYALPLLERMDEDRVTKRSGDERLPGPNA